MKCPIADKRPDGLLEECAGLECALWTHTMRAEGCAFSVMAQQQSNIENMLENIANELHGLRGSF